jgi:DNA-binding transcriptional MerR regulator
MFSNFSIKDLEKLSGIKAHTLRIWEQRYGILKPKRTDTNIRLYCNDELKQLLNIAMLYNNGYKISKIAALPTNIIIAEVNKLTAKPTEASNQIDCLIIAMVELDELKFEKVIANNTLHNGFAATVENVIYPFLQKIGIMWQTGSINPAQEHFISNLIRQKLIVAIDGVAVSMHSESKKFVLFLPDNELHELALLFYTYLIKARGHQVIYLGQSVPMEDLRKVTTLRNTDFIVTVFTQINEVEKYVTKLMNEFKDQTILLSGHQLFGLKLKLKSNTHIFLNSTDLRKQLDLLSSMNTN